MRRILAKNQGKMLPRFFDISNSISCKLAQNKVALLHVLGVQKQVLEISNRDKGAGNCRSLSRRNI